MNILKQCRPNFVGRNKKLTKFCLYPFPKQALVFTYLLYKSFENKVGKGEIARNEQFFLFPQCFLSVWRTFCLFLIKFQIANSLRSETSKICFFGKVKTVLELRFLSITKNSYKTDSFSDCKTRALSPTVNLLTVPYSYINFLAHLSTPCSDWAIMIDQCPASVRPFVNNYLKKISSETGQQISMKLHRNYSWVMHFQKSSKISILWRTLVAMATEKKNIKNLLVPNCKG